MIPDPRVEQLRRDIELRVPNGFRDEDGEWHHTGQRDLDLATLDSLLEGPSFSERYSARVALIEADLEDEGDAKGGGRHAEYRQLHPEVDDQVAVVFFELGGHRYPPVPW